MSITLALFALGVSSAVAAPSIDSLRASLWIAPHLEIKGEQATFDARKPGYVSQYEAFTLKFDRSTGRLRLTYDTRQLFDKLSRVEVWGTQDCLNMLRIGEWGVAGHDCVKAPEVYHKLTGGASLEEPHAPLPILRFLLEGEFPSGIAFSRKQFTVTKEQGGVVITAVPASTGGFHQRIWLSPDGSAITHIQYGEGVGGSRANFITRSATLTSKDFVYVPSEEHSILAETLAKDDAETRAKLQALIAKGSRLARIRLGGPTLGSFLVGYSRPDRNIEEMWEDLEQLGKLGIPQAKGVQGRWLAAGKSSQHPKRFQKVPSEKRFAFGVSLMWEAARLCDMELIDFMEAEYTPRPPPPFAEPGLFAPDDHKRVELQRLRKRCEDEAAGPELVKAAKNFADPWPSGNSPQ